LFIDVGAAIIGGLLGFAKRITPNEPQKKPAARQAFF
jgi:hypothetical protein